LHSNFEYATTCPQTSFLTLLYLIQGILVEDAESPRENRREFSVVILGFPGQIATDEQKKIVADLMGLSVESIVKVYAVNDY
jgi:hypothetical protein